MKVKFKRINSVIAHLPTYAHSGDGAIDIVAVSRTYNNDDGTIVYGTGLAAEIPEGYVGLLFPRSSIYKKDLVLSNSVGLIDSSFRGEMKFIFRFKHVDLPHYNIGDRIGQLLILPYPTIEPEFVDELSSTERNTGGFGSTGE